MSPPTSQGPVATVLTETLKLLLRLLIGAPLLLTVFWLLVVGTRRWRLDKYWETFPPEFGCNNDVLLDNCEVRNVDGASYSSALN